MSAAEDLGLGAASVVAMTRDRHLPRHAARARRDRILGGTSAAAALEKLEHAVPNLVLLDIAMPDRTASTSAAPEEGPRTRDVPVFVCRARAEDVVERALAAARRSSSASRSRPRADRAHPGAAERLAPRPRGRGTEAVTGGYSPSSPPVLLPLLLLGRLLSPPCSSFRAAFFSAFSVFSEPSSRLGFSAFSLFSTSSRIDIGALSPTRFSTWMIRVYPPAAP